MAPVGRCHWVAHHQQTSHLPPRISQQFDPAQALLPNLPKPSELKPFPSLLVVRYQGHSAPIHSLSPSPDGQWLATASADATLRVWEVATGRCMAVVNLPEAAHSVAWNPEPTRPLLAVAAGSDVLLLHPRVGTSQGAAAAEALLLEASRAAEEAAAAVNAKEDGGTPLATWRWDAKTRALVVGHRFPVRHVCWHGRGEYLATVAPTGNTQAVLVHQLSRGVSQCPFRKNKGRVGRVAFHPSKPFFFVATQNHVRVYNLAKQVVLLIVQWVLPNNPQICTGTGQKAAGWQWHHREPRGPSLGRPPAGWLRGQAVAVV